MFVASSLTVRLNGPENSLLRKYQLGTPHPSELMSYLAEAPYTPASSNPLQTQPQTLLHGYVLI